MEMMFRSDHFTLHALAEGAFAAIAIEGGAASSNAGLIDLGDRTLVFDAFENPQAAEDLLKASIQLTHRKPDLVIISHFHPDHWVGLQVFADCMILATHATRQAMLSYIPELLRQRGNPAKIEDQLRATEAQLEMENDPNQRKHLQGSIMRQRHRLHALPSLTPTLPNLIFEGNISFHGARRTVELISTGKGHTDSDCILRLHEDRLAFIGDLGFFQAQPYMASSSPPEWIAQLEEMDGWDVDTFVPGHGPLGSRADVELEARYIQALEELVQHVVQEGGAVEDALRQRLPAPFDAWQALGGRFETNVRSAYARWKKKAGPPGE